MFGFRAPCRFGGWHLSHSTSVSSRQNQTFGASVYSCGKLSPWVSNPQIVHIKISILKSIIFSGTCNDDMDWVCGDVGLYVVSLENWEPYSLVPITKFCAYPIHRRRALIGPWHYGLDFPKRFLLRAVPTYYMLQSQVEYLFYIVLIRNFLVLLGWDFRAGMIFSSLLKGSLCFVKMFA